jgi:hypothetical protein
MTHGGQTLVDVWTWANDHWTAWTTAEPYALPTIIGLWFVIGMLFSFSRQLDIAREQRAELLRELRRLKS